MEVSVYLFLTCALNCHELSGLKQHAHAYLTVCIGRKSRHSIIESSRQGLISLKSVLVELNSCLNLGVLLQLLRLLTELKLLVALGLRSPFSCQLPPRGLSQLSEATCTSLRPLEHGNYV